MTPDQHKAHLFWLMAPPFTWNWAGHVKARALELAAADSACADLPALVLEEFRRLKADDSSPSPPSTLPAG